MRTLQTFPTIYIRFISYKNCGNRGDWRRKTFVAQCHARTKREEFEDTKQYIYLVGCKIECSY